MSAYIPFVGSPREYAIHQTVGPVDAYSDAVTVRLRTYGFHSLTPTNDPMDPLHLPWLKAAALCLPLYVILGKFFFGTWDDFLDGLRFLFTPNWLSLLRGESVSDFYATLKMVLFLLLCAAGTFFVHGKYFVSVEL